MLRIADQSSKEQMTRLQACIDHLAICAPEAIRVELQSLTALKRARKAAAYRPIGDIADVSVAAKTAVADPGPAMAGSTR